MPAYAASSGTGWKGWMTSGRRAQDATHVLATLGLSPPCPKRTSHDYAGDREAARSLGVSQIKRGRFVAHQMRLGKGATIG